MTFAPQHVFGSIYRSRVCVMTGVFLLFQIRRGSNTPQSTRGEKTTTILLT